jgi:hypothetical protein
LRAVAGFDSAASACVTEVDLGGQRLLALRLARQRLLQHLDDIARCQQRQAWLMRHPLLGDEQHGQHHHGDVVVPGPPPLYVAACSAGDNISLSSEESGEPEAYPLVNEPVQ